MSDDDPAVPQREDPAVSMSAPRQPGGAEGEGDATGAPPGGGPEEERGHGRPTGWIVLCGVLAVAVVGLGIWALSAQSDADDSQAKLGAATAAAAASTKASGTPTPASTPTPTAAATAAPAATPDAATQQAIDQLTAAVGATNENLASI